MPMTAVGLFKNSDVAEQVVCDIESVGFRRNKIRTLGEPLDFGLAGVTSIPEVDFEVELFRELTKIGATKQQAEAYIKRAAMWRVWWFLRLVRTRRWTVLPRS
jgi:hypothetical protein